MVICPSILYIGLMIKNNFPLDHLLFRQMLELEFEDLERYIKESLALLKKSEAGKEYLNKELKSSIQNNGNEIKTGEDKNQFLRTTPFLLKHSLFISVYSFMEYSLKKICEIAASKLNQYERRVSNFEKVHQFYSFLINEIQIDKQKVEADWIKLNIFRDLRNSIIHYNSNIGKNISSRTYDFIKADARIEFEEPRGFIIKDILILELIETSKKFLFTLMDEYHSKHFPQ
jgi:hypothetical protein